MADENIRSIIQRADAHRSPGTPTHALSGGNVVCEHETRPAFDALLAEFLRALNPVGAVEAALVHDLAAARWRLCRAWGMETASIDLEVAGQASRIAAQFNGADEATVTILAFRSLAARPGELALFNRYEARHRRAFDRALRDLVLLQKVRKNAKVPVMQNEPEEPAPLTPSPTPQP